MDLVEIYRETGDFQQTVLKSGLSPFIVHLRLAKAGILNVQDKIKYGTKATKLGGRAEELFQKLVPKAVNANRYWKKNNPSYDYLYEGLSIDVKYSSLHKQKNSKYWNCRVSGSADIFVMFLEREENAELDNPYIILMPSCFVKDLKDLHIRRSNNWFKDFQVNEEQLNEYLEEYSGIKEGL